MEVTPFLNLYMTKPEHLTFLQKHIIHIYEVHVEQIWTRLYMLSAVSSSTVFKCTVYIFYQ